MEVAVVAMRMVQMAIHEVIHMFAVRDGLMPAPRPVDVRGIVATAPMARGAGVGEVGRDGEPVFGDDAVRLMMEVAVVKVVHVVIVADGGVATAGAVHVGVMRMFGHGRSWDGSTEGGTRGVDGPTGTCGCSPASEAPCSGVSAACRRMLRRSVRTCPSARA